ncbi:hypothetical protein FDUTEX481_07886 [Tolypothrix sp. PCC 7601]|nr:hypothetical protein FDUTEX481_07886 [Tolypothrix sp. PCC 7601]
MQSLEEWIVMCKNSALFTQPNIRYVKAVDDCRQHIVAAIISALAKNIITARFRHIYD